MKKLLLMLFCAFAFHFYESNAQILRPFTARYYNPSVRGNIVFTANNIITSTGGITTENPPGGTSVNNGKPAVYLDVDNPAPTTKLPFGSVWNYHTQSTAPANSPALTDWKQPAYIMTAAWNVGGIPAAGGGKYGFNSGQATCLKSSAAATSCTPGAVTKYTAYYFRNTVSFTATELSTTFQTIQLNVQRNDGIVIYINGVERARDNMSAGVPTFATLASADIAVGAAENFTFNLSPAFFTAGSNSIAVEVHLRTNTSNNMSFDMQVLGLSNNGTFSSTSADLSLPGCSHVLFAGLYWGSSQGTNGTNVAWRVGETNVKIKIPGAGTYTTLTSTQTDYHDGTLVTGLPHTGYRCFVDITSLVNATNPNGTYTIADVVGPIGINNGSGGWAIVVAYSNTSLQPRNLTVFDGSAIMNGGDPALHIPVSGFLTPPSGPVSCELGAVVYDGDRVSQDEFSFKQDANPLVGAYVSQTPSATANLNDMWNSTITYKGASVLTRNPAHLNTLGYDVDLIDVPNVGNLVLGNSQTSASIRFSSPSENYFLHCVTTSISNYNPSFAFDKTATDVNGGVLIPGDILQYNVNYSNVGNDTSTNSVIIDNVPTATSFLPGSIKINGVAKTDIAGDDEAEFDLTNNRVVFRIGIGANASTGGQIANGVSGNVEFKVVTATSCAVISCVSSISNSARINYNGKRSGDVLYDSSGVSTAGCIIKGPVVLPVSGSCYSPSDTLLVNTCPSVNVLLPWRVYAGYTIYSAMPFVPANIYNPLTPVTASHIYWAYFNSGTGCSDTARIAVFIISCPDIDDDNDGIPDYVELNNPVALQDANSNGTPNWNDVTYPGFVDNNADGFNDNFDPSADSDNDGIINFYDVNFPGYVDSNGDGVNDNMDKDMDGIPNHLDLDSDNDGIPDTVESYGVDANGDGLIDNYVDTDNDGFSQNVDASNTGVTGSNVGLGAQDFDNDGIPNYLDTDSDNDGIPDVVEVFGSYISNNGRLSNFVDLNGDGLSDNNVNVTALLVTGIDVSPVDGRADNYPNKNLDRDFRPNPYDIDSDADGITDVIEAGLPDANFDGRADGAIGGNGWSATIAAMGVLSLNNADGSGNADYLDIDSDDDGIPDNIEGMSTAGYLLPSLTDTDGDGLVNTYDNVAGFGGSGIFVYDHDGDGIPDYRDLDTDSDGQPDIIEGNDFNLNGIVDDLVTLTGLDTDGDGLDNRFDSLNSVTNIKGTSYKMGNGGSLAGDATPGTRSTVQKKFPVQINRDWRYIGIILPVQILNFTGAQQNADVALNWTIISPIEIDHFEIERSTDNNMYNFSGSVTEPVKLNQQQSFAFTDKISNVNSDIIYYRLKVIGKTGEIKYSNSLVIRRNVLPVRVTIMPNPAKDYVAVRFFTEKESAVSIRLINSVGKTVLLQKRSASKGANSMLVNNLTTYGAGMYTVQVWFNGQMVSQKLILTQ
ncbi:T9SS type A sorting domain-containing protein [Ferruginibacter sp.]|nr:T9SS type A sorting domain-containing protein [Ferruginibacter sp.]